VDDLDHALMRTTPPVPLLIADELIGDLDRARRVSMEYVGMGNVPV
jgi:hypothetical protein